MRTRIAWLLLRGGILALLLLAFSTVPARAESVCDPDGVQASGSVYRICMPASGYNGILVIWAHGFQDAGEPVAIPEDQLCTNGFCVYDIINQLGFGFATNSYSKTGLAVLQGQADVLDLVKIFAAQKGQPQKVYLVGASEGGIVTALNLEQHPDVFSAGLAACGPIGDFPFQINYFGDGRATFEYFFPGVIPGDPFHPDPSLATTWGSYYTQVVKPLLLAPENRHLLDQWAAVAKLPFDAANYLPTVEQSAHDVLRYSVVNLNDAVATLGGFPFENRARWYTGSDNDLLLNIFVPRAGADPATVALMKKYYNTTGVLRRPLISLHTTRDQQVPVYHESIYFFKTLFAGSWLTRHIGIPVDRYGHCNFNEEEVLVTFAIMLLYDNLLVEVSGTESFFTPEQLTTFERRATAAGLPTRRGGNALTFKLKQP